MLRLQSPCGDFSQLGLHPGARHGFDIASLSEPSALARLDGTNAVFVVSLGQLAARSIVLGDFATDVPAVQETLF